MYEFLDMNMEPILFSKTWINLKVLNIDLTHTHKLIDLTESN